MRYLEDAIASGVRTPDERDGRQSGWIDGVVTDVDTKLCRVKARIGKQEDNDSTDWLIPMFPGVIESVPRSNDKIAVFFMDGDPHRGAYVYFPDSNTSQRPSDAMLLGTTFAGMWNALQTSLYTTFKNTVFATHTHPYIYGTTAVTTSVWSDSAGHIQDSQGSQVADKQGDQKALSGRAKVGI